MLAAFLVSWVRNHLGSRRESRAEVGEGGFAADETSSQARLVSDALLELELELFGRRDASV